MKDKINAELLNLQDELQHLSGAVSHIRKAEELSSAVIDGVRQIQNNYAKHLNELENLFKKTLEAYKTESDKKLNDLHQQTQTQIDEAQNVLKDLKQKSDSIQKAADQTLQKSSSKYDEFLDKSFLHTKHQMEQVSEAYKKRIDEENEILAEFTRLSQKSEKVNREHLEKTSKLYDNKVNQLVGSHQTNVDKMNNLLSKYEEMGKATVILYTKINEIDFPTHLENIGVKMENLDKQIANYTQKISAIETKVNKNNKDIASTKYMTILVLVFVAAIAIDIALKYLP